MTDKIGVVGLSRANARLFDVLPKRSSRRWQRLLHEVLHVKGDRVEAGDGFIQAEQPLPEGHELPDGAVIDGKAKRCIRWDKKGLGHLWPDLVHTAGEWEPKGYPDVDKALLTESFLGKPAAQVMLDGKRLKQLLEALDATGKSTPLVLSIHVNDQGHPIRPVTVERCDGEGKGMIMPMVDWTLPHPKEERGDE